MRRDKVAGLVCKACAASVKEPARAVAMKCLTLSQFMVFPLKTLLLSPGSVRPVDLC